MSVLDHNVAVKPSFADELTELKSQFVSLLSMLCLSAESTCDAVIIQRAEDAHVWFARSVSFLEDAERVVDPTRLIAKFVCELSMAYFTLTPKGELAEELEDFVFIMQRTVAAFKKQYTPEGTAATVNFYSHIIAGVDRMENITKYLFRDCGSVSKKLGLQMQVPAEKFLPAF